MNRQVPDSFVSGGTGFIGRWLLASLTARGQRVAALVRRAASREAELKAFVDRIGGNAALLSLVDGDLEQPDLQIDERARRDLAAVRDVYHLGSKMAFKMTAEEARAINARGTIHALRWAAGLVNLRRFVYVGGYRVEAMPAWLAEAEYPLAKPIAARLYRSYGGYEASKLEAHIAVRRLAPTLGVPYTAVNPSGVIGDSRTGDATQVAGIGDTVERLFQRKLPALVGTADSVVPLITVDYLAAFIGSVAFDPAPVGAELAVLDPGTPTLPALVSQMAAHLGVPAPTRLLPKRLVRALPTALTGLEREALAFISEDTYDTASARAHARAAGLTLPPLSTALERWLDGLVSTRFLRASDDPRGGFRPAAGARAFVLGDGAAAERLLLHGIPWNANSWEPLLAELGGAAVRPDLPGLGRSQPLSSEGSEIEWIDDVLGARSEPIEIVGHSLGAGLAVRYARARPDRVKGVTLISPAFLQRRAGWLLRRSLLVAAALRRSDRETLERRLLGANETSRSSLALAALASAADDLSRGGVARRAARALAVASQPEVRRSRQEDLTALIAAGVSVTIVTGEDDPLVTAPRGATAIEIPGAGHSPHVSHPIAVAAAVRCGQPVVNEHGPGDRISVSGPTFR